MDFYDSQSFYDALSKLDGESQKAAKLAVFDLRRGPDAPGLNVEKLSGRAGKRGFYSARATRDVRIIYHRGAGPTGERVLLCHVARHDAAYAWAERRRVEPHPRTGAMQMVVLRERVEEVTFSRYVEAEAVESPVVASSPTPPTPPTPGAFASRSTEELLSWGVPADWVDLVRGVDAGDESAAIAEMPEEAAEALRVVLNGGEPAASAVSGEAGVSADPFEHPDARRRFRAVAGDAQVQAALDGAWAAWTVFLHPDQRAMVGATYAGPARAMGSAGTGKTVVALHRAAALGRDGGGPVLLTTFSRVLARQLREKFRRLAGDSCPGVSVRALDDVGIEAYERARGRPPTVAPPSVVRAFVRKASADVGGHPFSLDFLCDEFQDVVDAWQLTAWEQYRDVKRLGRRRQVGVKQREQLWPIFGRARASLAAGGLTTMPAVFAVAAESVGETATRVVVDEAQDVSLAQLRYLAALAGGRPDGLFFAGDVGQRIFAAPFSWLELGVDVRGRSRTLKVNYRTSGQIRAAADRLLDERATDADGVSDERGETVSAFDGPEPSVEIFDDAAAESARVAAWLGECAAAGIPPVETAVFVRSASQVPEAVAMVAAAGLPSRTLEGDAASPGVLVAPMHDAKGLEFRAVAVARCDDAILPDPARVASAADEREYLEVERTERHLLYVACTRSRERLLVSGVRPESVYLRDLRDPRA